MILHNHIIGIFYNYDIADICTLEDLKEKIVHMKKMNEFYIKNHRPTRCYKYTELEDLLDNRKATSFKRFEYCPVCGEKINYRKIIEENKTT